MIEAYQIIFVEGLLLAILLMALIRGEAYNHHLRQLIREVAGLNPSAPPPGSLIQRCRDEVDIMARVDAEP